MGYLFKDPKKSAFCRFKLDRRERIREKEACYLTMMKLINIEHCFLFTKRVGGQFNLTWMVSPGCNREYNDSVAY